MAHQGLVATFSRIPESHPRPFKNLTGERFALPLLLESVPVTSEGAHNDYMSVGKGEFSQAGSGPMLQGVTLNSLTMTHAGPFHRPHLYTAPVSEPVLTQAEMLQRLGQLRDLRTPFSVVLFDVVAQVNFLAINATLRSVERQARSKEADTWYWTLQLKEWRRATVGRRAHQRRSRKSANSLPGVAILTATDTLNSLAREWYGTTGGHRADDIAQANGISRFGHETPLVRYKGSGPRFHVGSRVTIPVPPGTELDTHSAGQPVLS